MRILPAAVVGSVVLGFALAGPAMADEVTPTATSTSTATATDPVFVPLPAATATAEPTTTATAEPTPTVTDPGGLDNGAPLGGEDDVPIGGAQKVTPGSGPAGTKVKVASVDKCESEDGKAGGAVATFLLSESDIDSDDDSFTDVVGTDTNADGSWTNELTIPADAEDDSFWAIVSVCYAETPDKITDDTLPLFVYDGSPFVVTTASKAAPAKPVAGTPAYTG